MQREITSEEMEKVFRGESIMLLRPSEGKEIKILKWENNIIHYEETECNEK